MQTGTGINRQVVGAGPVGSDSRRPFSFVAAVRRAESFGVPDQWRAPYLTRPGAGAILDAIRDADRMRSMARHRAENEDWSVDSYCAHVLPITTERAA